jgi:hypothetical protein
LDFSGILIGNASKGSRKSEPGLANILTGDKAVDFSTTHGACSPGCAAALRSRRGMIGTYEQDCSLITQLELLYDVSQYAVLIVVFIFVRNKHGHDTYRLSEPNRKAVYQDGRFSSHLTRFERHCTQPLRLLLLTRFPGGLSAAMTDVW